MHSNRIRHGLALLLLLTLWSCLAEAEEPYDRRGLNAWMGAVVGQHFTGQLNYLAPFPMAEFRTGYRASKNFTTRIDLGLGLTEVSGSNRESFQGAGLMASHLSLSLLYSPNIGEHLTLNLGGTVGVWFVALWGEDLLDTSYGSTVNYLEAVPLSTGIILGLDWSLDTHWALTVELRYNHALAEFAGTEYNAGGLGVFTGFLYRMAPSGRPKRF